jgi:hypothetical protein
MYGTITNCYSTGAINFSLSTASSAVSYVGGLLGKQNYGVITNCRSAASVDSFDYCSASNNSSTSYAGGLVGFSASSIEKCYSTGPVFASATTLENKGGLVGFKAGGSVGNSFWDIQTSGISTGTYGTGKTTVQMKTRSTYTEAEWDFTNETANGTNNVWRMCADG